MIAIRSTLPLFAAVLLLGQGPLCELLCAPTATTAPVAHEAIPPCHGPASGHERAPTAPEPSEHECAACDQIAASGVSGAKAAAPLLAFALGGSPNGHSALRPTAASLASPDGRAPPGRGRDLLLRKSSLLL